MRPCLALPFTIVPSSNQVRLLAGEDFRYTLNAPALETWLPTWLPLLDGQRTLDDLLALLPEDRRHAARVLVESLYGERVVVEGPVATAFTPCAWQLHIEGSGVLVDSLLSQNADTPLWHGLPTVPPTLTEGLLKPVETFGQLRGTVGRPCHNEDTHAQEPVLRVFCQDRLDYDAALQFNRRCLDTQAPWLWATCGPLNRGYVGPLFLPEAGPCFECLLSSFQRLSPAPELYDELIQHVRSGGEVQPSSVSSHLIVVLRELVLWKAELSRQKEMAASLFRLHVVEAETMEVSSHRVFVDPHCTVCRGRR